MGLRFHLVVSDVDPGNEDFMCKRVGSKMFPCVSAGMERFSLDLLRAVRKGCDLGLGCGSLWNLWSQTKTLFDSVI